MSDIRKFPSQRPMKLFSIREDELARLEKHLPAMMSLALKSCNEDEYRRMWKDVQSILSDVRWDGGPPEEVREIPA